MPDYKPHISSFLLDCASLNVFTVSILACVTIAGSQPRQFGEGRVYSVNTFTLQPVVEEEAGAGTQSVRTPEARADAEAKEGTAYWLAQPAF